MLIILVQYIGVVLNENYIDILNYNFSNDWIKTNKIINRKSNIEYINY